MHESAPVQVAIYLCRHSVVSSVMAAMDAMRLANRLAGRSVFALKRFSVDGNTVLGVDAALPVDGDLSVLDGADLVILPAIGAQVDVVIGENRALIERMAGLPMRSTQPVQLASLCSGAFLLAASGVVDGRRATTHWSLDAAFRQRFPKVRLNIDAAMTHDGPVLCSGGAQAGLDLCLYLVELHGGRELARRTAEALVYELDRGPQSQYRLLVPANQHDDSVVWALQQWINVHYAENLSLQCLADQAHITERTLLRRFKAATGLTPNDYVQRVRLEAAKARLELAGSSIDEIVAAVGYEDRATFSRLFKRLTGQTPAGYRERRRAARKEVVRL